MFARNEFVWLAPNDDDGIVFCPRCLRILVITTSAGVRAEMDRVAEQHQALVIAHTRSLAEDVVKHQIREVTDQHQCPARAPN